MSQIELTKFHQDNALRIYKLKKEKIELERQMHDIDYEILKREKFLRQYTCEECYDKDTRTYICPNCFHKMKITEYANENLVGITREKRFVTIAICDACDFLAKTERFV